MASQYWGATPGQTGNQTLYNPGGSPSGMSYNTNPATGYPQGQGYVGPNGLALTGPYGGSSTMPRGTPAGNPTTNIGGYWYTPGTPAAYAAQQYYNNQAAGSAGGAVGNYTNTYLNSVPALSGLINAGTGALGAAGGALGGVGGGVGSTGTGVGSGGGVGGGVGIAGTGAGGGISGGNYVPAIAPIDTTAANTAAFAKAKDLVGQTSRSSADSLNSALAAQGLAGGGAQTQALRDVITAGQGELGDVTRGLAQTQAGQNLDLAKTNQGAAITQRGQDIAAQQAQAQLALEQRQQNFQLLNTIINGLKGLAPGLSGGTGSLTGASGPLTGLQTSSII